MHLKKGMALAALWWSIALDLSADACSAQAQSAMEQAYCQIKMAGFGASLPTLHEFKRNPEKTQRLLLLRPALRAGVALPEEQKPVPVRAPAPPAAEPAMPAALPCQVQEDWLLCGSERYRLLGNRANRHLEPLALTSSNQLQLASFSGSETDSAAVLRYLDDSYQSYIEAMVSIGLAASTMSFTKFYHTFIEVQASDASFAGRMATMFEYLKKDKKAMAVQRHFNEQRPQSVSQCRQLNRATVVCDDVKNNWVFRLIETPE